MVFPSPVYGVAWRGQCYVLCTCIIPECVRQSTTCWCLCWLHSFAKQKINYEFFTNYSLAHPGNRFEAVRILKISSTKFFYVQLACISSLFGLINEVTFVQMCMRASVFFHSFEKIYIHMLFFLALSCQHLMWIVDIPFVIKMVNGLMRAIRFFFSNWIHRCYIINSGCPTIKLR